jgi:hypothetical protein
MEEAPPTLEAVAVLTDSQIRRLNEAGVMNCLDLAAQGSTSEERRNLAQQTGIGEPTLHLSAARARLLTLDAIGGAYVRHNADLILPPESDPIEAREESELMLSEPAQDLATWVAAAIIEMGEEEEEEKRRVRRKRGAKALLGLSGIVVLAAMIWP